MEKTTVYLWGFSTEAVTSWPPALDPVFTTEWPAGSPVVVHADAVEQFYTAAEQQPLPDGRVPEAILYLPQGVAAPQEAWAYFDATVEEGDWSSLLALLSCPRQFALAQRVEDVPAALLQRLHDRLAAGDLIGLPLPGNVQDHLRTCRACRAAVQQAIEGRLWVHQQLRHAAAPAPQPVWARLTVPLRAMPQEVLASVTDDVRRVFKAVVTLLQGCVDQQLIPPLGAVRSAEGARPEVTLDDLREIFEEVYAGEAVRLYRSPRALSLGWDAERAAVWIDGLLGEGMVTIQDFQVTLRRGATVLWEANSQEGKVVLPLTVLEQAFQAGADALTIDTRA